MSKNHFEKNFDYGSFLPMFLFIVGVYSMYSILNGLSSQGIFIMLFAFLIYVGNNVLINFTGFTTLFNEYLEDMSAFFTFAGVPISFGLVFFKGDLILLIPIFFYAICVVLAMARNWVLKLKNSVGFPIALNGVFFPFIYYFYLFYLDSMGASVFVFYYLIVGFYSISQYNFLGYREDTMEKFNVVDSLDLVKRQEKKEKQKSTFDKKEEIQNKIDSIVTRSLERKSRL